MICLFKEILICTSNIHYQLSSMDFVKKTVGEEIRITTTDGRICTGILTCFDANGNFLFREVSECVLIDGCLFYHIFFK